MRALSLILFTALLGLWSWFALAVAPGPDGPLRAVPVAARDDALPGAGELNNSAVALEREGRPADALAYLERAHDFRPGDAVIATNLERQRHRVERTGWLRALIAGTIAGTVLIGGGGLSRLLRGWRDGRRFAALHQVGDSWLTLSRDDDEAELALRFNRPVRPLLRRHGATLVWSSARHGKHMKSRPPAEARDRKLVVSLDRERIERLRRYPGDWKAFVYLGRRPVGEAVARVV